jgi:hypothetical protein
MGTFGPNVDMGLAMPFPTLPSILQLTLLSPC